MTTIAKKFYKPTKREVEKRFVHIVWNTEPECYINEDLEYPILGKLFYARNVIWPVSPLGTRNLYFDPHFAINRNKLIMPITNPYLLPAWVTKYHPPDRYFTEFLKVKNSHKIRLKFIKILDGDMVKLVRLYQSLFDTLDPEGHTYFQFFSFDEWFSKNKIYDKSKRQLDTTGCHSAIQNNTLNYTSSGCKQIHTNTNK